MPVVDLVVGEAAESRKELDVIEQYSLNIGKLSRRAASVAQEGVQVR